MSKKNENATLQISWFFKGKIQYIFLLKKGFIMIKKTLFVALVFSSFFSVNKIIATPQLTDQQKINHLFLAAVEGDIDSILSYELSLIDTQDKKGKTPLMYAIETGNIYAASLLVKLSKDLQKKDFFWKTALDHAKDFGNEGLIKLIHLKLSQQNS